MRKVGFWLLKRKAKEELNPESKKENVSLPNNLSKDMNDNLDMNEQKAVEKVEEIKKQQTDNITSSNEKATPLKDVLKSISGQGKTIPKQEETTTRTKSSGFVIKDGKVQIPDAIISNLIENFVNKKFQIRDSQLNVRQNSTIKDYGFDKWDTINLIKHRVTKEYEKMLKDKYGYRKDQNQQENIPLAFYFDLSGSMCNFSHILSLIALKILQRKIKLLIGYNETIVYQFDELPEKVSVEEFQSLLTGIDVEKILKNQKIQYAVINQNLDEYLIEHNAQKVALFTDFDPISAIKNLSRNAELYWFCFEQGRNKPIDFKGKFYKIYDLESLVLALKNIDKPNINRDDEEELWR